MRKLSVLLMICMMIPAGLMAQKSGPIITEKKGLKKTYTQQGTMLKPKELGNSLSNYPASAEEYSTFKMLSGVGSAFIGGGALIAGGGALYFTIKEAQALNNNDLAAQSEYSKKGTQMLGVGIATMLVGLPFTILGGKSLTKSIDLYNAQYAYGLRRPVSLDLGATLNGVGICLNF